MPEFAANTTILGFWKQAPLLADESPPVPAGRKRSAGLELSRLTAPGVATPEAHRFTLNRLVGVPSVFFIKEPAMRGDTWALCLGCWATVGLATVFWPVVGCCLLLAISFCAACAAAYKLSQPCPSAVEVETDTAVRAWVKQHPSANLTQVLLLAERTAQDLADTRSELAKAGFDARTAERATKTAEASLVTKSQECELLRRDLADANRKLASATSAASSAETKMAAIAAAVEEGRQQTLGVVAELAAHVRRMETQLASSRPATTSAPATGKTSKTDPVPATDCGLGECQTGHRPGVYASVTLIDPDDGQKGYYCDKCATAMLATGWQKVEHQAPAEMAVA